MGEWRLLGIEEPPNDAAVPGTDFAFPRFFTGGRIGFPLIATRS